MYQRDHTTFLPGYLKNTFTVNRTERWRGKIFHRKRPKIFANYRKIFPSLATWPSCAGSLHSSRGWGWAIARLRATPSTAHIRPQGAAAHRCRAKISRFMTYENCRVSLLWLFFRSPPPPNSNELRDSKHQGFHSPVAHRPCIKMYLQLYKT